MSETNPVDDYAERMRRNPYAFPMGNPTHGGYDGMTLRDYFAAKIAGGMAAHSGTSGAAFGPNDIAKRSYEVADAMLAARSAS